MPYFMAPFRAVKPFRTTPCKYEYAVACEHDNVAMSRSIGDFVANGWEPVGNISTSTCVWDGNPYTTFTLLMRREV